MNNQHLHKWEYCCQLRKDIVVPEYITKKTGVGQPIETMEYLVKKDDSYKILFNCGCGETRILLVSNEGFISKDYNSATNLN